uniref:Putative secreted protein n=1 Tax=Anopheles darlingi TaxID=43151 RepID=A0A2M4D885_ANODA
MALGLMERRQGERLLLMSLSFRLWIFCNALRAHLLKSSSNRLYFHDRREYRKNKHRSRVYDGIRYNPAVDIVTK